MPKSFAALPTPRLATSPWACRPCLASSRSPSPSPECQVHFCLFVVELNSHENTSNSREVSSASCIHGIFVALELRGTCMPIFVVCPIWVEDFSPQQHIQRFIPYPLKPLKGRSSWLSKRSDRTFAWVCPPTCLLPPPPPGFGQHTHPDLVSDSPLRSVPVFGSASQHLHCPAFSASLNYTCLAFPF